VDSGTGRKASPPEPQSPFVADVPLRVGAIEGELITGQVKGAVIGDQD